MNDDCKDCFLGGMIVGLIAMAVVSATVSMIHKQGLLSGKRFIYNDAVYQCKQIQKLEADE